MSGKRQAKTVRASDWRRVSKVRHGNEFLYTFYFRHENGTRYTIQVVFGNDDRGALNMAKRLLNGDFSGYGYGYFGYGYRGEDGYGYLSYGSYGYLPYRGYDYES